MLGQMSSPVLLHGVHYTTHANCWNQDAARTNRVIGARARVAEPPHLAARCLPSEFARAIGRAGSPAHRCFGNALVDASWTSEIVTALRFVRHPDVSHPARTLAQHSAHLCLRKCSNRGALALPLFGRTSTILLMLYRIYQFDPDLCTNHFNPPKLLLPLNYCALPLRRDV